MYKYCPTVLFDDEHWTLTASTVTAWLAGQPIPETSRSTAANKHDLQLASLVALATDGSYASLIKLAQTRGERTPVEQMLIKWAGARLGDSFSANDLVAQVSWLDSHNATISTCTGWCLIADVSLRSGDISAATASLKRADKLLGSLDDADQTWVAPVIEALEIRATIARQLDRDTIDLEAIGGRVTAYCESTDGDSFALPRLLVEHAWVQCQLAGGVKSQAWFTAEKLVSRVSKHQTFSPHIVSLVRAQTAEMRLLAGDTRGAAHLVGQVQDWTDESGHLASLAIGMAGVRTAGAGRDEEMVRHWAGAVRTMHANGLVPSEAVPAEVSAWEAHVAGMQSRATERSGRAVSLHDNERGSSRMASTALQQFIDQPASSISMDARLTRRERQVADLLINRMSNKEIADHLDISVRTAEHHVANVLEKLGVGSRRDLPLMS